MTTQVSETRETHQLGPGTLAVGHVSGTAAGNVSVTAAEHVGRLVAVP
jgi:hypothetical protein